MKGESALTAGGRHLVCPYGCQPGRFELIGGAVFVDSSGSYLSHEARVASFRCDSCGAVAVDLAQAAKARSRDMAASPEATLTCPSCGARLLPPQDLEATSQLQCPECDADFSLEEGSPHLLGDFSGTSDDCDSPEL